MTLYHSTGIIAASGGAAAKPGIVLLTPTSIAHSGTSASIGANGQVTFTAVTSLSLNGVFSATYDNYVISVRFSSTTGIAGLVGRMRASGSDNSTANSYVSQMLNADSTTVSGARYTQTETNLTLIGGTPSMGFQLYLYGAYLAQPTAGRTSTVVNYLDATLRDFAFTHNQSTSYDGFTFFVASGSFTGKLAVYGVRS